MVKKKAPVIPLTIVAVMIAVAFAVNTQMRPKDPEQAKEDAARAAQAQAANQPAKPRPPESTSDLKAAMTQSLDSQTPAGKPKAVRGGAVSTPGAPGESMMVGHKVEAQKPKPSATSTDSSWYVKR